MASVAEAAGTSAMSVEGILGESGRKNILE